MGNEGVEADSFDVLLVGSGAAGLYAALCLPKTYRVGLITKDVLTQSASDWAQGGIAAAMAPEDSPRLHQADTLRAGAGLCDPQAVAQLVEQAAPCIQALVDLGVPFDRHHDHLAFTLEAAHSQKRVLHAADTTGRAVVATLAAAVRQREHITVLEETFVLDLWLDDQAQCRGVIVATDQAVQWLQAGAVVLATGGGGQVFAQTTNPAASTGDGMACAWRAGARLRDLEFFQFHPTALKLPDAPRFLISEAVRGEGAHLVDEHQYRFAFEAHPEGELAPRDVVSRAIYRHLQAHPSSAEAVYLDLSVIPPERVRQRFPNIIQVCQRWGIDLFTMPIPVSPAAHYWMGGVMTNLKSYTTLPGVYAVGETASTGVHGANRLASNSLLECLVYGRQLADLTPQAIQSFSLEQKSTLQIQLESATEQDAATVDQIRAELPQLMWQGAGICRNHSGLTAAIAAVEQWRQQFALLPTSRLLASCLGQPAYYPLSPSAFNLRHWGETRNLLDLAWLVLKSALFRQESRGGHYREDYPEPSSDWQVHTLLQGDRCWTEP
ncbi:MAG: L-aspartate oxidase [Leptolyngbyaceae cyanobacterium]